MSDRMTIDPNDIPEDWLSFTFETKGGKLVTVIRDDGIEPGDCDYFIMAKNIKKINDTVYEWKKNGQLLSMSHIKILVEMKLIETTAVL